MASWDITIELPAGEVIRLLRTFPAIGIHDTPTGLGITLGDGQAAWVDELQPDDEPTNETDVVVKDRTSRGAWRIYEFLAGQTKVPMRMRDDGGMVVIERNWSPTSADGSQPTGLDLRDWDSREVGRELLELARTSPLHPPEIMRVLAASGVAEEDVRERSLELVGELVRANLLRPESTDPRRNRSANPGRLSERDPVLQELVFDAYRLFPSDEEPEAPTTDFFAAGPLLLEHGDRPITTPDVQEWMRSQLFPNDERA